MNILIIGGGICGLGTALLLGRDGHEITVLERDADSIPVSAEDAWEHWGRKGVAQFRQPHNFMPGLRLLLEAELRMFRTRSAAGGRVGIRGCRSKSTARDDPPWCGGGGRSAPPSPMPGPNRNQLLELVR